MTGPTDVTRRAPDVPDAPGATGDARDKGAATAAIDALTFDAALAELERTVASLESGGGPLEETIALYEYAVALERRCSRLLGEARLRMDQLVERAGGGLDATTIRAEASPPDA
ncbi:MAG TPA: exodeoxyribonuclease VII small subunit [Candidatus Acidoferrum sp.]|nr:exodeoxyribonuclease VII small subunit [Candidatus Acidoferrum sp.]